MRDSATLLQEKSRRFDSRRTASVPNMGRGCRHGTAGFGASR